VGWINLAQDRDLRWALTNTVMNLRVPYKTGKLLTERLSASQRELCSMESAQATEVLRV
jgi:hypothetical protein